MQTKFHRLSKPELEFLKDNCNFSEDEIILFNMACKRCSDIQIAGRLNVCTSTVTKRKREILGKINVFLEEMEDMVTVYINGKPVTKEEMRNYKLQIKQTGDAIKGKLTKISK